MGKSFWIGLITAFVVINEILVDWVLAVFVGDYGVAEGFTMVTRFLTVDSLLFAAGFRAIPYGALLLVGLTTNLKRSIPGKFALWSVLFVVMGLHFCGYWHMLYASYTPQRMSSTAVLNIILVPLNALPIGAVAGSVVFMGARFWQRFRNKC